MKNEKSLFFDVKKGCNNKQQLNYRVCLLIQNLFISLSYKSNIAITIKALYNIIKCFY